MSRFRVSNVQSCLALQEELNRFFDEMEHAPPSEGVPWSTGLYFQPAMDALEEEGGYTLLVELPGVSLSDLELQMEGHSLVLSGDKKIPDELSRESFQLAESAYGPFRRVIHLPAHVDPDSIEARLTDGLLRITVRKLP